MQPTTAQVAGGRKRLPAQNRYSALWHSLRFRGLLYQAIAICTVLSLVFFMAGNADHALTSRGIHTGFGFLSQEAGFSIGEALLPFESTDSFLWAFIVGLGNTLWVSLISLIAATALGTLLGIMRLSSNWLVTRVAVVYIEIFRNTPQLMQIVFWYTLMTLLPNARQAWQLSDWLYLSKRGLVLAWPADHHVFLGVLLTLLIALVVNAFWLRWADRRRQRTGKALPAFWIGLLIVLGAPALFWLISGAPRDFDFPRLTGFNFRGGVTWSPEFLALTLGLTLYFAAYIAEIVRSGIQSVRRGQIEAGRAVGLRPLELYRRIILPQALRVIVPPITAQYISLVKTSALGVAIGYPELFNVTNTMITVSGHTIECVLIMGVVYLALALSIAAAMNLYNKMIAIKGGALR